MDPSLEVKRHIGQGAYGKIYLITNQTPQIVLKEIPEAIFNRNECLILERINHSNIVALIRQREFFDDRGKMFAIYMEYCERGTLKEQVFDSKLIYSMTTILMWSRQLFSAIDHLYGEWRTVHSDIKPANILVKDDFTLKIGDFGSVEKCENTFTGEYAGTKRYMSPTMESENGESKSKISHKNDVYSLGLVIWEMIERRLVFAEEYGSKDGFKYDKFLFDIISKDLTQLKAPECPEIFAKLVSRCAKFDRSERPTANEALNELNNNSNMVSLMVYHYLPIIEEDRKSLLKPIGFDNTTNQTTVYPEISDLPDITSDISGNRVEVSKKDEPPSLAILKLTDDKRSLNSRRRIVEILQKKFQELTPSEKLEFQQNVQRILDNMSQKIHKMTNFDQEASLRVDNQDQEKSSIERVFENLLINDYRNQGRELTTAYLLSTNHPRLHYCLWKNYRILHQRIEVLEEMKRFTYTTRFYLDSYISFLGKEEWLYVDMGYPLFLKKSLSEACLFRGTWLSDEKKIFLIESKTLYESWESPLIEGQLRVDETDELHYTGQHPVDFYSFIEALRKEREKLAFQVQINIKKFVDLKLKRFVEVQLPEISKLVPIPGYLFQKRNPPRHSCTHKPKCSLRGFPRDTDQRIHKRYHDIKDERLQIPIYECSPLETIEYLHEFFELVDGLKIPLSMNTDSFYGETICPFENANLSSFNPKKSFLLLQIPNFLNNDSDDLVVLDSPDYYRKDEKLICFTYKIKNQPKEGHFESTFDQSFRVTFHRVSTVTLADQLGKTSRKRISFMQAFLDDKEVHFQVLDPRGNVKTLNG